MLFRAGDPGGWGGMVRTLQPPPRNVKKLRDPGVQGKTKNLCGPSVSGPGTFERLRGQFEKLRGQELFLNSFLSMQRHRANFKISPKVGGALPLQSKNLEGQAPR